VTTLTLPWPPNKLSPNARLHWGELAKAKKAYRTACYVAVKEQRKQLPPGSRFDIALSFVPPTRRSYDRDNLTARMKSGLDGMADALGIDDSAFVRLSAEMVELSGDAKGGFVVVRLSASVRAAVGGAG